MINRRTMLSLAMGTAAAMATRSVIAQGARTGTRIVFLGTRVDHASESARQIRPISSWSTARRS